MGKQPHGFVKSKSCTTNILETIIAFSIVKEIPVDVSF